MMQYSSLYALSRFLDCPLSIPGIDGFPKTSGKPHSGVVPGARSSQYVIEARHFLNCDAIRARAHTTIANHDCAYLENTYNFHEYRADLVAKFALPTFSLSDYHFFTGRVSRLRATTIEAISPRDLVISLRLGDFVSIPNPTPRWQQRVYSRFLGFDYFDNVLRHARFERLFITSDEPFHPLVDAFHSYEPILVQNDSPVKTMSFIGRFDMIAISESTYSWWAAYLSNAHTIYYPISTTGLWAINTRWNPVSTRWETINVLNEADQDLYLRVDDEKYKYVHQLSGTIYNYRDAPGRRTRDDFL